MQHGRQHLWFSKSIPCRQRTSFLLKGIPAGSLARSILQVACSQVAKNTVSQDMGQVQRGELANIIGLLSKHLSSQDNEVGNDVDELRPAAGHTVAGVLHW